MPVATLKTAEAFGAGDVTVFVFAGPVDTALSAVPFGGEITAAAALDKAFWGSQQIIASGAAAGGRVIAVHAGLLNKDTDDVRRVGDAVVKGIKRAIAAGATEPLLVLHDSIQMGGATAYENATLVALIAAAGAVYTPLSIRLDRGEAAAEPVRTIHVKSALPRLPQLIAQAAAIEEGKRVARDVGGGDPELMAPIGCAEYLRKAFEGLPVSVSIVEDAEALRAEYPLAHAVARCVHAGAGQSRRALRRRRGFRTWRHHRV
jgi:leucyl aminopeptidase